MTLYKWSQTAATNATADSTVNYAEGQAPSSINDSARAAMAAVSKYRDDIAGAIATGGTSTAYTVASYQVFDTLANMSGKMIAFTPHVINGATVTLNVDSLGAKPLRWATGVELQSNTLIAGTPYVATYSNGNSEWVLQGVTGSPYGLPLGAGVDYWGTTTPNSAFVFPTGQAISRTTYATLFSILGTTFGAGDSSTTFNLPDKRGRVSAAWDAMGGSSASRFSPAFGAAIGEQTHTLTVGELPASAPTFTGTAGAVSVTSTLTGIVTSVGTGFVGSGSGPINVPGSVGSVASTGTFTPAGTISNLGSGTAHNVTQPTIVCNYILRII